MHTPILALATLATAALAVPLNPRQAGPSFLAPYVGAPQGDFFRSSDKLECELLRISFGGGQGPPYVVNFVSPPPDPESHNASLDDVHVLEQVGFLGMPGFVYWDIDSSTNLSTVPDDTLVALQVIDRAGNAGYSVNRHVRNARLNEHCHRPGAFWPPSRWDGTHFSILLLAIFFGGPFSIGFLASFKAEWAKSRAARRSAASDADAEAGTASHEAGDVQLQDRRQHVLGDDDDERTSLEEDEDRPLLLRGGGGGGGGGDGAGGGDVPEVAPPGYEEAVKEDLLEPRSNADEHRV